MFPGSANLFVASGQRLPTEPEMPADRLRTRRIHTRLVSPNYLGYLYTNDRLAYISGKISPLSIAPNSDARPICYPYTLMIWLSKYYPALAVTDINAAVSWAKVHAAWGWLFLLALAVVFRLVARWPLSGRSLLAGLSGLLGMVGECGRGDERSRLL